MRITHVKQSLFFRESGGRGWSSLYPLSGKHTVPEETGGEQTIEELQNNEWGDLARGARSSKFST